MLNALLGLVIQAELDSSGEMKRLSFTLLSLWLAQSLVSGAEEKPLPSPAEFDPAKYMGKWFEVARIPSPVQPKGSLATAEYTLDKEAGVVTVKNTAYDAEGNPMRAIEGKALPSRLVSLFL